MSNSSTHLPQFINANEKNLKIPEQYKFSPVSSEHESHVNRLPVSSNVPKPILFICNDDPTATANELSQIIAQSGLVFNRGGPVRVYPQANGTARIIKLEKENVVILAHELTTPMGFGKNGRLIEKPLPDRIAKLYLALENWPLQELAGIATTPMLSADGSVRFTEGYDPASQMWLTNIPDLSIPQYPSLQDAQNALAILRSLLQTLSCSSTDNSALSPQTHHPAKTKLPF